MNTPSWKANGASGNPSIPEDCGSVKPERSEKKCTCGFCDGVTIEYEENPRTGEVSTFERMSRRPSCPNCGGRNVQYRSRYVAHAADVVGRVAGGRNVYAVHITLDSEAVQRAGIAPEETYEVWTGDGGPWTRARSALRYRDAELAYFGSLSARPSDGAYHLHVVLVTRRSVATLRDALHAAGLNVYVQDFDRSETADSKEQFAAMWAAYAFDNAAHGPSARFVSSNGAGYNSREARRRRREAATGDGPNANGNEGTRGRSPRSKKQKSEGQTAPASGPNTGRAGTADAPNGDTERGRAPPIRCDGHTFDTVTEYTEAVKGHLSTRVGTLVRLDTGETAELLAVRTAREGERGLVRCTVHVKPENRVRHVPWREIEATNTPRVRTTPKGNAHSRPDPMDRRRPDEGSDAEKSPAERFSEAANTSKVSNELEDGRRRVTEKNHDTGRVREYVLPPREH